MAVRSVHWHEGMFLWPQQMQQAERFYSDQVHLSGSWDMHYRWGLRGLDLDLDALGNSRFLVRVCVRAWATAAMVDVPGDTILPASI